MNNNSNFGLSFTHFYVIYFSFLLNLAGDIIVVLQTYGEVVFLCSVQGIKVRKMFKNLTPAISFIRRCI